MRHTLFDAAPLEPPAKRRLLLVGGHAFPVEVARHPRARRYVVRVTPEGGVRLTVPWRASIAGGLRFAERQRAWIAREWIRQQARSAGWTTGTVVWFRGERLALEVEGGRAVLGGESVPTEGRSMTVREAVESHLRAVASRELSARTRVLAAESGIAIAAVSVRDQRSRWGSCSPGGGIALNWRLIQMPPAVSDYVIFHELAHRRHGNHSIRFWREVERLCPWWRDGERWLRKHGRELL
jgi:hypothetical protein